MKNAIFIDNKDETEYKCNICSDVIQNDKIIGLSCNPSKHIFCYDCIYDWYSEIKINQKKYDYVSIANMCPICRKSGGLLPIYNNCIYVNGIHQLTKVPIINLVDVVNHMIPTNICGAKFITKTGFCQLTGKEQYGGFCCKHSKNAIIQTQPPIQSNNSVQNTQTQPPIQSNNSVQTTKCGFKFKTKLGLCKSTGKVQFNGLCGLHFKCNVTVPNTSNLDVTVV